MSEKFIAIKVVAQTRPLTFEEREALEDKIIKLLGCIGTEPDCPMILFASTTVDDVEVAIDWLH